MKVLLITESLVLGGAETLAVALAGALAEEGIEVSLCAADGPVRRRLDPRVRYLALPPYSASRIPSLLFRLSRVFSEVRPDIVHAHGLTVGALGMLVSKLQGRPPGVLTHHSPRATRVSPGLAMKVMDLCFRRVIAVSKSKHDLLLAGGLPPSKVLRIPNFVDLHALCGKLAAVDRAAVRAELALRPEQQVILTSGRLVRGKGMDRFIEIVARYAAPLRERPVALILGDGPERAALEAMAMRRAGEARVEFLGYQDLVHKYLAIASVFLFPSSSELLPMALIEAQAAGVPVVCSDIPGNDEVVLQGRTGYLVDGDDDAYCLRLADVLRHEATRVVMSREASAHVLARFDKAAVVRRHKALYAALKISCTSSMACAAAG